MTRGFPDSSVGKESACNAGDPGSIPGSGRSAGEVIGDPLQYSCAFLVAQMVKNPPAMRETWVQSLGWEDTLEKGKATHSSIPASTSASLTMPKSLTVWITTNCGKKMGIPDHLTCLLRNLYAGQEATVRTGHGTDWFQIRKGVYQGCILSP